MRSWDDLTYHDYKDTVHDAMILYLDHYSSVEETTNRMMGDLEETFEYKTSTFLWLVAVGECQVRHGVLEERILQQLIKCIPQYEQGYYRYIEKEEREELEQDIAYLKENVKELKN